MREGGGQETDGREKLFSLLAFRLVAAHVVVRFAMQPCHVFTPDALIIYHAG